MTDKELLELAAKAAGYILKKWCKETDRCEGFFVAHLPVSGREAEYPEYWYEAFWNPLYDDGDALRLAVKLMDFQPYKGRGAPFISSAASETRRAITIAAATIGKEMQ